MNDFASRITVLDAGWEVTSCLPDQWQSPTDVTRDKLATHVAVVPGTVACVPALLAALDGRRVDELDHWYRLKFRVDPAASARRQLCFDGLATLADIWLDGQPLLHSDNMFLRQHCDVTALLADGGEHELWICFRALLPVLQRRRPRGRWPTRLVSQKHLRFVRTSLLGYMPGWYPELPPVGPWRAIRLLEHESLVITSSQLRTRLDGDCGVVSFRADLEFVAGNIPSRACLQLAGGSEAELLIEQVSPTQVRISGELREPHVAVWWPHTHGNPALHSVALVLTRDAETRSLSLGRVGFRTVVVDRGDDGSGFALRINQRDVFCRGACWSPLDVASVHVTPERYREALEQVRDAGFNMLRISGVMAYESDTFYELCDQLGVLVWQDFMFANMDYPVEDPAFMSSCAQEVAQLCERLGARPCLAVLCGGSEVMQQAAMMGVPVSELHSPLFDQLLPSTCRELGVDVPYVPSSPSGGALPFHVNQGVGHYYGVGAYLRPLDDVRLANVRFASECLAFSNPPEVATSLRAPRDPGAAWDFADVTDHYVKVLFGSQAGVLRESDPERYRGLCRVTTGEVMARVMQHWRRRDSGCAGALVWLLRDPQPGPGWGLIDCDGVPKAAYHYLRRALAPRAMWFSDEGVNGILLHVDNETAQALRGEIDLSFYRDDGSRAERGALQIELPPFGQASWNVEGVLGYFVDASYAYRFGPRSHVVVVARWASRASVGETPAPAFHALNPELSIGAGNLGISAHASVQDDGYVLSLHAQRFAQAVHIQVDGYDPSDNYIQLEPNVARTVVLRPRGAAVERVPDGTVTSLQGLQATPIHFVGLPSQ